ILLVMTVELATAIIVAEDKPTSPQPNKKLTYPSHTGVFHQPLVAIDKQYSTLDIHHHPGGRPLPLVHQAASSSHSHGGHAASANQGGGHKHHQHHKGGEADHHKHQLVANTLSSTRSGWRPATAGEKAHLFNDTFGRVAWLQLEWWKSAV
ncbi:unnamed protein product, partial [Timema podura]|nr:unnamed protein product [Timema podura]